MSARQPRLKTAEIDTKNHRSGFGGNVSEKGKNGVRNSRGFPRRKDRLRFSPRFVRPATHARTNGICAPTLVDFQPNYSYPGQHQRIEFMNTSESLTGMMVSPGGRGVSLPEGGRHDIRTDWHK